MGIPSQNLTSWRLHTHTMGRGFVMMIWAATSSGHLASNTKNCKWKTLKLCSIAGLGDAFVSHHNFNMPEYKSSQSELHLDVCKLSPPPLRSSDTKGKHGVEKGEKIYDCQKYNSRFKKNS